MSDKVSLNTFPSTESQALALLYIQKQDISGLTPEEFYDKYRDAYERIRKCKKDNPRYNSVNGSI